MEYLPGISLQDLVDEHGPLPPARAGRVLTQLCGALREAHGYGLVHRDIKPGNVMLCERGGLHDVAKLLDYGLVVANQGGDTDVKLTQAGMIVGTPAFMSPEQCGSDAEITAASDIYKPWRGCVLPARGERALCGPVSDADDGRAPVRAAQGTV
jgi:serine/threonine-protein kinase